MIVLFTLLHNHFLSLINEIDFWLLQGHPNLARGDTRYRHWNDCSGVEWRDVGDDGWWRSRCPYPYHLRMIDHTRFCHDIPLGIKVKVDDKLDVVLGKFAPQSRLLNGVGVRLNAGMLPKDGYLGMIVIHIDDQLVIDVVGDGLGASSFDMPGHIVEEALENCFIKVDTSCGDDDGDEVHKNFKLKDHCIGFAVVPDEGTVEGIIGIEAEGGHNLADLIVPLLAEGGVKIHQILIPEDVKPVKDLDLRFHFRMLAKTV